MNHVATTLALVFLTITSLVNKSQADQAGSDGQQKVAAALKTAREELVNGVLLEKEKLVLGEVFIAEQVQKAAGHSHDQARSLVEKKIITPFQLESAAQAATNAEMRLDIANAKLKSFREAKAQVLEQFDRLEQMIRVLKVQ